MIEKNLKLKAKKINKSKMKYSCSSLVKPILYESINIWFKILQFIPEFQLIIDQPDYLYEFYTKQSRKKTAYELAKKIIYQQNVFRYFSKNYSNCHHHNLKLIHSYFPTIQTFEKTLQKQRDHEKSNWDKHFYRNGDPKPHPIYLKLTLPPLV